MGITRLQLGASRFEALDGVTLQTFLDKSWIHFGDPAPTRPTYSLAYLIALRRSHSLRYILNRSLRRLGAIGRAANLLDARPTELYSRTNFAEFYYQKGDRLPFDDHSINFVFSEHFFEHLFFDESLALLRECNRILKPAGVIRTCVPDADLRTYAPPEPLGYPDRRLSFASPKKHKSRWSVYSLAEAIEIAGFKAVPLRYCDKSGNYIKTEPSEIADAYEGSPERELICHLSYVLRKDALIVDGVKKLQV